MKVTHRIAYSQEFDQLYGYAGEDLGATYTREETVFRLWSPLADGVTLRLYRAGTAEAEEEPLGTYQMEPLEQGVWRQAVAGDLHGVYYDFEICRGEETVITADPYAKSCGCNGYRSMVVDLRRTDPEGFDRDVAPPLGPEQIIYELHIKDFSYDPDSGIPAAYRGKYKAFTVEQPQAPYPTGVAYLRELGITHVHLLPFFDFSDLDESGSDRQFNWGYDPLNYNVPEGSFATDPYDGTVRIRECKEMIQALHRAGIRVVMDVVYNHTFSEDSWLERTAPGYFCRRWPDGTLANGSACGSDLAAGRAMVDRYITQSVLYWAKEYHVDGFRFDLMGLLTVELMNHIRAELDKAFGKGEILLYGEPWRADPSPMEPGTHPALKENLPLLDENIAVFSDDIRDTVKGHALYVERPGFVNGGKRLERRVLKAPAAWRKGGGAVRPKSAAQIVSYISAHDNNTLWDKLVLSMRPKKSLYTVDAQGKQVLRTAEVFGRREDIVAANKLAALIYFTCQGYVFFQAGEEFGRTKLGDDNSYRSAPELNMLRWAQTQEFSDLLAYYKGLIALRKQMPGLYDKSPAAYARISQETVHATGVVSFLLDNRGEGAACPWTRLWILFNASQQTASVPVPTGNWSDLADGVPVGEARPWVPDADGAISVPPTTGMILGEREEAR